MFRVVENVRRQHLDWYRFVLEVKGWDAAELSRRTGKNPSTFSKFVNDPENKAQLGPATVRLIEQVSGLKAFSTEIPVKPRGLAETESSRFEAEPLAYVSSAVKMMQGERNGLEPWVMRSRALDGVGYMPGDILLVDLNARPEPGDIVCAQVYDRFGNAETVFRVFEDPFLVSVTMKVSLIKPLLIDNDRVVVRGVVVASFRERHAA